MLGARGSRAPAQFEGVSRACGGTDAGRGRGGCRGQGGEKPCVSVEVVAVAGQAQRHGIRSNVSGTEYIRVHSDQAWHGVTGGQGLMHMLMQGAPQPFWGGDSNTISNSFSQVGLYFLQVTFYSLVVCNYLIRISYTTNAQQRALAIRVCISYSKLIQL